MPTVTADEKCLFRAHSQSSVECLNGPKLCFSFEIEGMKKALLRIYSTYLLLG